MARFNLPSPSVLCTTRYKPGIAKSADGHRSESRGWEMAAGRSSPILAPMM